MNTFRLLVLLYPDQFDLQLIIHYFSQVLYIPHLTTQTYTRSMMEDMYDIIQNVPQKVNF